MSRQGRKPVQLNAKVKVDYTNQRLVIKGPKGELFLKTSSLVDLNITKESIQIKADFTKKTERMMAGTTRQLIKNMVIGVTEGFKKQLNLVGVGYRVQVSGQKLVLNLGFSHAIEYELPTGISAKVEENTQILLEGFDKQALGQTAAEIRSYRPPEPYKGKGVKYSDEVIRRKAGKSGKK